MPPATRPIVTAVAVASMLATPALAQDDDYDRRLASFAATINRPIKLGQVEDASIAFENGMPKAGYYRIVVRRTTPGILPAEQNKFCSDSVRQIAGGGAIQDFVLDSKYDMGVSLVVNLDNPGGTQAPGTTGPAAANETGSAELLLFRITKSGGRCDFRPTFFDSRGDNAVFEMPWRPIDRFAPTRAQTVKLAFRPWLSVSQNAARLGLLDGLLSDGFGLFNLKALFGADGKEDTYGVKSQGRSLFEPFDTELRTGYDPTLSRILTYSPGADVVGRATSRKPERIEVTWEFKSRRHNQQGAGPKIGYSIEVQYRSSQVSSTGAFDDMSDDKDGDFQTLLANAADPSGTAWNKTSDIKGLLDQKSIADMGVACALTEGRLRERGLSQEDQSLLLYAAARATERYSPHQIGAIKCFSDPIEGTRIRSSLATWKIELTKPHVIPSLPDIAIAFNRISLGFSRPGTLEKNKGKDDWMGNHLADSIHVSGSSLFGAGKDGNPILTDRSYTSAELIAAFSRLPPGMQADCEVWSETMQLPALSDAYTERALAFLASRKGDPSPMLVVVGFDEMKAGYARASAVHAAAAGSLSQDDRATKAIFEAMKAKCDGNGAYKRLMDALAPKPAAPAQTVADGGGQVANAPTPPGSQ